MSIPITTRHYEICRAAVREDTNSAKKGLVKATPGATMRTHELHHHKPGFATIVEAFRDRHPREFRSLTSETSIEAFRQFHASRANYALLTVEDHALVTAYQRAPADLRKAIGEVLAKGRAQLFEARAALEGVV